jgi:hypothetical protein
MSEEQVQYETGEAVAVRTDVLGMIERARAMTIATEADRTVAGDVLREAKRRAAAVAASFDDQVKASHSAWKAAVAHRAKFLEPLEELERVLRAKVTAYDGEQQRKRDEAARAARAAAEAAAELDRQRLLREADRRKTDAAKERLIERAEAVIAAPVELPPEPAKREGESYATTWDFEVVDEDAIPRRYMIPDAAMLKKLANATRGKEPVPGVRWIERRTLRVRM